MNYELRIRNGGFGNFLKRLIRPSFIILHSSFLIALLALCGCATVEVSSENGRTMVDAENSCWRIFWWLPLGGGDCDDPNDDFCVWFRNTVTLKNNMKLLDYAREKKGARSVKDVQSYIDDNHYLFILRRTSMHSSAELVY